MRPREDELLDPEIVEQLDAIDATLAGDPVDPRYAELAELALLLSADPPRARPEFTAELDRRVASRFGVGGRAPGATAVPPRRTFRWGLMPTLASAGGAVAAAVIGVALLSSGGAGSASPGLTSNAVAPRAAAPLQYATGVATSTTSSASSASSAGGSGAGGGSAAGVGKSGAARAGTYGAPPALAPAAAAKNAAVSKSHATSPAPVINGSLSTVHSSPGIQTVSPTPLPNGRKVVQSSMLELGAPANRIDAVAQEVFDEVADVNGIVESSNVSSTGGPGASAQFQLRIPSALLPQALGQLSRLRFANVISRTDNTQDVNSPFVSAERRISEAKSALIRLRSALAAATSVTTIAKLRGQIAGEKATIAQAQGSARSINRSVNFSNVEVSLQASTRGSSSGGGGFGVGKAGHDALRVLEVTAGVALIALAALVPVGLLIALLWWLALTVQRRRRERALDLA